jgi:hypothetical protein
MFNEYGNVFGKIFVTDTRLPEGIVIREEPKVNRGKSIKFLIGILMPIVESKEGQNLKIINLNKKNRI